MLESQHNPKPLRLTYQGRPRTWGFRLSTIDVVVLVASVALTIGLWQPTATYSFIGLLVVIHFFLFCNVFRIPRGPELLWGACFLLICCGCLIADVYSPLTVALSILPVTLAIIGWCLRLPTYHGVLAKQINPQLDDYLTGWNDPVKHFNLPTELINLIEADAWPRTKQEFNPQRQRELIQELVPEESEIWLSPPPFRTIAECCEAGQKKYWDEFGSLDQIDPACTLLIGDFGLGTETAIALDYRQPDSPPVLRLAWVGGVTKTRWVPFFASFKEFAVALKLLE